MRSPRNSIVFALLTRVHRLAARAADAAAKKKAAANRKGDKSEDADESAEPEVKLPPILLKALHEKEAQVTAARREAIGLIESYLRDSPHSQGAGRGAVQAGRALLGGVQGRLPREDGRSTRTRSPPATTTARSARTSRASRPPSTWRRRRRSTCGSSTTIRSSARSTRSSTCTRSRCAIRARRASRSSTSRPSSIKYPRSRYIADAWMAIAEFRFYEQQNYKSSLEAYEKVLAHPKSQLYDLALFKTAWCYWKLGDTTKSALRFKDVLDLAKKKAGRTEEQQKRAAELQGQALDYLVELFTEDDTKSAHDAFEFLAQIGGKQYSRKVLKQLADTVFDQTRYERAVEAYRLLIELDPNSGEAPDYHGKIVESYQLLGDVRTAVAEMRKLAGDLRRAQPVGRRQQGSPQGRRARAHAGRGPDPHARQDDARRGAAEREDDQGGRQGALRARRRVLRVLPRQLPRRRRRERAALPARRHPLLQAGQVRGGGSRVPGWSASRSRWASSTRTRCCRRWARSRRCASRASARSPRPIACSARRPTSTRRCSRRTRRSSPSSTRTGSSSSTTATTTRRSSASA